MSRDNKKAVKGKAIYTLDMYLNGIPFEQFLLKTKIAMLLDVVDMEKNKAFYVKFTVNELQPFEVDCEIRSIQLAHGQYCLNGEFVSVFKVEELVKQHCKAIELNGYIEVEGDTDEQNDR